MENPREGVPSSLNSNTDPDSDEVEGSDLPNDIITCHLNNTNVV